MRLFPKSVSASGLESRLLLTSRCRPLTQAWLQRGPCMILLAGVSAGGEGGERDQNSWTCFYFLCLLNRFLTAPELQGKPLGAMLCKG